MNMPAETLPRPGPRDELLPRHMIALDSVRGVAILLVLLSHFAADLDPAGSRLAPAIRLASLGWVGVDLFFVLSGFLITGILFDTKRDPAYFKNFYMRRAVRIFPLYYGVLTLALILAPQVGWSGIRTAIGAAQPYYWLYGVNVLILLTGSMLPLAHFWSLAVEEHFYLIWPLAMHRGSRRTLSAACLGLVAIASLTRALMLPKFPAIGIYVFTPCRMDALAIGALAALVLRHPGGWERAVRPAIGLAITSLAALGVLAWKTGVLPQFDRDVQLWGYTLLAMLFGSVVILVAPHRLGGGGWVDRVLGSATLRFFGKYSYGAYVLHPFVMGGLNRLVPSHRPGLSMGVPSLGLVIYVLAGIVSSQALAYASWHVYEKPFLKLKKFFEYRARPADTAG